MGFTLAGCGKYGCVEWGKGAFSEWTHTAVTGGSSPLNNRSLLDVPFLPQLSIRI